MDGYEYVVHYRSEGEKAADFRIVGYSPKGAANPWSVIVTPDDKQIIVAAAGSQELVRIDRIALHERLAKAKQGVMVTPSVKSWNNIPNDAGFCMASATLSLHRVKVPVRLLLPAIRFIQPIIILRNWFLWI